MNIFQEDIKKEFERINLIIDKNKPLSLEDLKIILLAELSEENFHEGK